MRYEIALNKYSLPAIKDMALFATTSNNNEDDFLGLNDIYSYFKCQRVLYPQTYKNIKCTYNKNCLSVEGDEGNLLTIIQEEL